MMYEDSGDMIKFFDCYMDSYLHNLSDCDVGRMFNLFDKKAYFQEDSNFHYWCYISKTEDSTVETIHNFMKTLYSRVVRQGSYEDFNHAFRQIICGGYFMLSPYFYDGYTQLKEKIDGDWQSSYKKKRHYYPLLKLEEPLEMEEKMDYLLQGFEFPLNLEYYMIIQACKEHIEYNYRHEEYIKGLLNDRIIRYVK